MIVFDFAAFFCLLAKDALHRSQDTLRTKSFSTDWFVKSRKTFHLGLRKCSDEFLALIM